MNRSSLSRIGNWNVRTLKNKEIKVIREMECYELNICVCACVRVGAYEHVCDQMWC